MADASKVSDYSKASVAWCLSEGVISGMAKDGERYVEPQTTVDRARSAQRALLALRAPFVAEGQGAFAELVFYGVRRG